MLAWGIRLTARGVALLLCGVLVSIAGALVGEPDLAWIGIFLCALPLLGVLMVLFTRPRLRVERHLEPSQTPIGVAPRARLRIINQYAGALSSLEFSDAIPTELGSDARFNLTRGFGTWDQAAGYSVPATQRGRFRIGPLRAKAFDPFGTALATWQVKGEDGWLRVTPRIWDLSKLGGGVSSGSAGESTPQRIGQAGTDDVLVREHRHGDDIRRVHWRMSAKQDELMVRLEEHPWDPTLSLIVDNRTSAHFGSGPDSTLEWCVSAAASVSAELLANRYRVTILSADDVVYTPSGGEALTNRESMIHAMTDLRSSARHGLDTGLSDWDALSSSQSLMATLGLLTPEDATVLSAIGSHMHQTYALVPDAAAWGANEELYDAHRDACRHLRSSGWTLQTYRPGQSVPEIWRALTTRSTAA